jgi:LysM repeat protein
VSGSNASYTVQVGDTLGGIADKTGVPLDQIQTLNPNVDPHAMTAGQKIKLK